MAFKITVERVSENLYKIKATDGNKVLKETATNKASKAYNIAKQWAEKC